jgi:putative flippase GtrA
MNTKTEIIRFSLAGVLIIAADLSLYYLLFHFLPYSVAKGFSFTCAGILGYLLNKYWIFKPDGGRSFTEAGRYAFINVLALGINVVTNQSILNLRPDAVWPALMIATAVTSVLTFVFFKWWVFKE